MSGPPGRKSISRVSDVKFPPTQWHQLTSNSPAVPLLYLVFVVFVLEVAFSCLVFLESKMVFCHLTSLQPLFL